MYFGLYFNFLTTLPFQMIYSSVPNRSVGWNKHVGRSMVPNSIIMLDGINMLVGICIFENEVGMLDARNLQNFKPLITHRISCGYQFCSKAIQNLIIGYFLVDLHNKISNSTLHVGLNKHVGRNILLDLINMLFLIRACWMDNSLKN